MTADVVALREEQLARLLAELNDRVQAGGAIDIEEVCRQHPEVADELRPLWGMAMLAEAVGSSSSQHATEAFAEDAPSLPFTLPYRFGDYELLEEVGRGGMGLVFRARQISLNREVAIKMILRGQLASPAERERFRAEAAAAAQLDHPAVVPVYEVGETEGHPYFSMKYIRGSTLAQRLAEGPMPPRLAAKVLVIVSRAIDCAHRQGLLHRDLKPSNILIDEEGRPHVTDFGLAKQVTDPVHLTRSGAVLGTPAYMAPEQAAGMRGQVGPASDVYSLGSILYHTLTGRPPFQGASPVDTVLMLLEQDVVPPRVINPRADRDLELIALRCLQKPSDLRYGSADALANDLDAYLKDEPIAARTGRFTQVLAQLIRETHHATVLENWGVLWMWHSLVLFVACVLTNALHYWRFDQRWSYIVLWTFGVGTWAAVFWWLRRRVGPVTFVERQIAHLWAGSMIAIGLLFFVEILLDLPVLTLSPVLALIAGMIFTVKAGILSGSFYFQAVALYLTTPVMALFPDCAHLIFGFVCGACFFLPGLKYYRQRVRSDAGLCR